jgi:hypothetical protein
MAAAAAAASGAVWLGYYPDGSLRQSGGPRNERTRRKLPAFDWFRERLVKLGGDGLDRSVLSLLGGGDSPLWGRGQGSKACDVIPIVGLARVSNFSCVHSDGPLAEWSDEGNLLRHYFSNPGEPLDAYSVCIEEVRQCAQLEHLTGRCKVRRNFHRTEGDVARISLPRPLFLGAWPDRAGHVHLRALGRGRCSPSRTFGLGDTR